MFYDSFTTTPELLTKVAGKLRGLAQAGDPLTFSPLTRPVTVTWRADFDAQLRGGSSSGSALEVLVVPLDAQPRSTRLMSELATVLPNRIREGGLVAASEALPVSRLQDAVMVSVPIPRAIWNAPRDPQLLGARLDTNGQVSAWASLPGDGMGSILDPDALREQLAGLLRLIGFLRVIETTQLAIAAGVDPTIMLSTGRVGQVPRQSASMLSTSDRPLRVPPDELVTLAALDAGALEVGRALSRALLEAASARH